MRTNNCTGASASRAGVAQNESIVERREKQSFLWESVAMNSFS